MRVTPAHVALDAESIKAGVARFGRETGCSEVVGC